MKTPINETAEKAAKLMFSYAGTGQTNEDFVFGSPKDAEDFKQLVEPRGFKTELVNTSPHNWTIRAWFVGKKTKVATVDFTPSWVSLIPVYVEAASNGNKAAWSELERMARLADAYVKERKS